MVTLHEALTLRMEHDWFHLDIKGDKAQIRGGRCTLTGAPHLRLVEWKNDIPASGFHVKIQILMVMTQETLPVVMITVLVLVQEDLGYRVKVAIGETVTGVMTEMAGMIRVLEINPVDRAMKTVILTMILYYV